MRNVLVCGIVLVLLGFSPTVQAGAPAVVKIGVIEPLSGNAAAAGQATKAAIEVAADIINRGHPELARLPLGNTAGMPNLGGAKVQVIFADHQGIRPSGKAKPCG